MRQRHEWTILRVAMVCADACAVVLAFTLVLVLFPNVHPVTDPLKPGIEAALRIGIYVAGWLALLVIYRLYDPENLLPGSQQYTRLAQASTAGLLLLVGIIVLVGGNTLIPRVWLLASWLVSMLSLALTRFCVRRVIWRLRRHGLFRSRTLIVGAGEDGLAIAEHIRGAARLDTDVVGFLDEYSPIGLRVGDIEVLGEPLALARIAKETGANEAIVVAQAISWESLQALLQGGAEAYNLERLWLAPAFRDLVTTGMEVHQRGPIPLLSVAGPRITGIDGALKRGFDLTVSLLLLPIAVPLTLVVVLWLAGVMRVHPFARQHVIGGGRRRFAIYTFNPVPAMRSLHIWRVPALWNILRGELSLVGPRPINRAMQSDYRPWHMMLASVRPGLTGPWWLMSGSEHISIAEEVGVDLAYIRNYTIWADARILALTAQRLLRGRVIYAPSKEYQPEDTVESTGIAQRPTSATSGGRHEHEA